MRAFRAVHRRAARMSIGAALLAVLPLGSPASSQAQPTITVQVSSSQVGQAMPKGFVGVSVEYRALHRYTGSDPHSADPVLVGLLRGLAPGQRPVLRVGGDSTDWTWWPVRGVIAPKGISYELTNRWLRTTRALSSELRARLILGINLAIGKPALAAAEAREVLRGIGRRSIEALEIGNEPDLYSQFVSYRDKRGRRHHPRSRHYNVHAYLRQFARWRAALPVGPLAGPAFAGLNWMRGLRALLASERRLALVTFHRYPLRACAKPGEPGYPTLSALLSDASSSGLASGVAPYVAETHAHHRPFRLDELNSVACRGRHGVSDTFASALWALDTLFNMASVGVDGVNFHTLPGAKYQMFSMAHSRGVWRAFVHPDYYGMLMFTQAFPPRARLLSVSAPAGAVKAWATQSPDGHVRATLINKDPSGGVHVQLKLPGAQTVAAAAALTAPRMTAESGVSYGRRTFGSSTRTGRLPPPASTPVSPTLGTYIVDLPPASALLITK